ncbi:MAG TPA: ankyrin repeat domain-containing protein [Mucilaginibacter sp.]|nr:ankyrin repeat domain-containing protein [Mucilaginibacter sp.]
MSGDYRLFQGTPAWSLAKAVLDEDTAQIKTEINKDKALINFREPRFGQPLLQMAVINKNYQSAKALLDLGANPNLQDHYWGKSPLMSAAGLGMGLGKAGSEPRFLQLLLKFGADPNAEENGPEKQGGLKTPLMLACRTSDLSYVKILVDAGADINHVNKYGESALGTGVVVTDNPDIVLYLLEKGADFSKPFSTYGLTIAEGLRYWRFDLNSDRYRKKMQIVAFLKKNKIDYWKTKIPDEYLNQYPKAYLEKY